MKLMESYQLEKATSWEEFCAVHARFVGDFNHQAHFAHQEREDGLRTPAEVLGDARGRHVAVPTLQQLFEMLLSRRIVDAQGYIRYHHWRVYGDEGLAGTQAGVWLAKETHTLTLAADTVPVAQYAVTFAPADGKADGKDDGKDEAPADRTVTRTRKAPPSKSATKMRKKRQTPRGVARARETTAEIGDLREAYRFPSPRPLPQPHLWDEETSGSIEWRKVYRLPAYAPRRRGGAPVALQLPLLPSPQCI